MTTATVSTRHPAVRRPALSALARTEWRLFLREPVGLAWGLVIPVGAFVVLGVVPATSSASASFQGRSALEVYQPIILLLSLAMLGCNALPPVLSTYRERGVLRRLAVTPMPAWRMVAVQLGIHAVVGVATAVLLLGTGVAAFSLPLPARLAGWVLVLGLTLAAVLAIGVLVAALAPSAKVANAVGAVLFFPLMFFAGLWLPRDSMPDLLGRVSDQTPLGAAVRGLTATAAGTFPPATCLLVLAAWALGATALAIRCFRWA